MILESGRVAAEGSAERLMADDPQFANVGSDKRAELFIRVTGQ